MADHSRLGRGLASLIGDVGEETLDGGCKPQAAPCGDRKLAAQSAQPAPHLHRRRTQRAFGFDPRARHHPADRGAPRARRHRRLQVIAGERRWRAAQRAGLHPRGAGRHRRSDRRAGARIRHHRKRPTRRLECDRGSGRLSGADGRIQSQPGRRGADRRQEPLARRQHGAPAQVGRSR